MPSFYIESKDSDSILHNKYGTFSKFELEEQLKNGYLTIEELGYIYDLPKYKIAHVLISLGIDYRNTVQQVRRVPAELSSSSYQIVLGTMMGDAYIRNGSLYEVSHSINQMDYLYHIAENIGDFVSSINLKYNGKYKSISLRTVNHEVFKRLNTLFYSRGSNKKFFKIEAIQSLSSEGLAYWYMDDGKYNEYGFNLCVGNITEEEGILLVGFLKDTFNIESTFQWVDKNKGYHVIYIKAESRDSFLNLISPYIIPSMKYKIEGTLYPKLESVENIVDRHVNCCRKLDRIIKFTGDDILSSKIGSKLILPDPKKEYIDNIKNMIKEGKLKSHISMRQMPNDKELEDMFKEGMTDQQIAEKYGYGRTRISNARNRLGIERKRKRGPNISFPCLDTKLIPVDKIVANSYNPNKVAYPEMELLIHSIEEDGVTQPVVTFYDEDKDQYIVIDGFHRYTVLKDHFKCLKIPVVVIKKDIKDRMASTIRHNRARGKHTIELMGVLVNELSNKGWKDEEIVKHLGMEGEELLRLRQQVKCATILAGSQYSNAWSIVCQEK